MKKTLSTLIVVILFFFSLTAIRVTSFAEEAANPLITELHYDKEKQVLTGKTAPNANISLADIVATIVADDNGDFEVPIPKGLERTTLTFMDFINDESTDVDYDFVAGTIATEETEESTKEQEQQSNVAVSSIQKETASSVAKPTTPKEQAPKKKSGMLIWVLLLVILVVLTVAVLIAYKKRETAKKAQAHQHESSNALRSTRRKRRRKSPKPD